jgi:AraC-like DNA-binding protein
MYSYFIKLGLTLGLLMVLRLFIFYKKSNTNTLMLAIALFCLWYTLLINYLNETRLILHYPFLIRTGLLLAYLMAPFLYVYVRNSFYPGRIWKKTDWLFFLPSVFYLIDLFPFFISSPEYKIAVYTNAFKESRKIFKFNEGWIGIFEFHIVFVYLWSFIWQVMQVRLIVRNRNIDSGTADSMNRPLFWFLVIITILYIPLTLPGVFGILMHLKWFTLNFVGVSLTIVLLTTTLYLFYYPDILYGFGPRPSARDLVGSTGDTPGNTGGLVAKTPDLPVEAEKSYAIPPAVINVEGTPDIGPPSSKGYIKRVDFLEIIAKLETYIADHSPYLDQRYSIHDLAVDVGIPVYQLSPIINQYYHDNFNSWINRFRVDYFINLWGEKENRELTIDALARKSGFSNRITFINAFKKEKKTTPTIYLKK